MRAVVASVLLLISCGYGSGVWLRVGAPLHVPADCNALKIVVDDASSGVNLDEHTFVLDAGFPHSQVLLTRGPLRKVRVTVDALLDGRAVTSDAGEVDLVRGDLAELDIWLPHP